MSYSNEQLESAFMRAHAAGNAGHAAAIAAQIRAQRAQTPPAATNGGGMGATSQAPNISALDASSSGFAKAKAGLANTGIQAYLGLKQMFGDLSPEEQQVRKASSEDADSSWQGKVSNVVGDIALTAIPGAKAGALAARGASALPKSAQAISAILAAGAGQGATSSAFKSTEDRGDRIGQLGVDIALGAGLNAATAGVVKAGTKMFTPTHEAQKMFDIGINSTLPQGTGNEAVKKFGQMSANMFDVSGRQGNETLNAMLAKTYPGVNFKGMDNNTRISLLDELTQKSYKELMTGNVSITARERQTLFDTVNAIKGMRSASKPQALEAVGTVFPQTSNVMNMSRHTVGKYRKDLQGKINDAAHIHEDAPTGTSKEVLDSLIAVRERFDRVIRTKGMTPENIAKLQETDEMYDLYRRMVPKVATAQGQRGLDVEDLRNMYKGKDFASMAASAKEEHPMVRDVLGPANRLMGETALYNQARAGYATASKIGHAGLALTGAGLAGVASPLTAAVTLPALAVSSLGQTAAGSKFLFGQYGAQKKAAELVRKMNANNISGSNMLYQAGEELTGQ